MQSWYHSGVVLLPHSIKVLGLSLLVSWGLSECYSGCMLSYVSMGV